MLKFITFFCAYASLFSCHVVGQVAEPPAAKDKVIVGLDDKFKVSGESLLLNKAVTGACNELAKGLRDLLGEKEVSKVFYPIRIEVYSKGNAKKQNIFRTLVTPLEIGGFHINLIVDVRERIDRSDLEAGIMQAIVMERTMRTDPALDAESVVRVPRWVSDGLLGAIRWREGSRERGMYEVLLRKPELFPLEKLFATQAKDIRSMGRTMYALYEASATAMVMSLYRQPSGKESLVKMLSEVAVFQGEPSELLRKYFPALNVGNKGLDKMWNLQLAEMSAPRLAEMQTIIVTEKRLQETLFFTLMSEDRRQIRIPIENYQQLFELEKKDQVNALNLLRQELIQVGFRAYADYQPLLIEYGFILTSIAKNELDDISNRLAKLAHERSVMLKTAERTRDVLDWYSLSNARELKGDFTGYQRLLEQMKREKKAEEQNPISTYLKRIEALMSRSQPRAQVVK